LKIRHDTIFVSSVLLTVAFLTMAPGSLSAALVLRPENPIRRDYVQMEPYGELGIVSLAMVTIGLIVTWTGFFNRVRWTWFVMLTIVFGWAFPVRMLIFVLFRNRDIPLKDWISGVFEGPGIPRDLAVSAFILTLMVIALILPIKSFFWKQEGTHGGQAHPFEQFPE